MILVGSLPSQSRSHLGGRSGGWVQAPRPSRFIVVSVGPVHHQSRLVVASAGAVRFMAPQAHHQSRFIVASMGAVQFMAQGRMFGNIV